MEHYLRSFYKMDELREFRCFFGVKGHYLGNHEGHGRSLSKFANVGIVLIYLAVTSFPIFEGSILGDKISINWQFLFSSSIFTLLIVGAFRVYKAKRKLVIESLDTDWFVFLERFPAATWQRVPSKL